MISMLCILQRTHYFAGLMDSNTVVSVNVLQRKREQTLWFKRHRSANFCARNPPRDAPNKWTYVYSRHMTDM